MMITCTQTKAIQSHIIMPSSLNNNNSLYGGQMMKWLDETAGISVARVVRGPIATASIDNFNFLNPLLKGHSICIETFVSGIGKRSLEVFSKVIGEDLRTGERFIAATGFMTWVALDAHVQLPQLSAETAEEQLICQDYQERRDALSNARQNNQQLVANLSRELPW